MADIQYHTTKLCQAQLITNEHNIVLFDANEMWRALHITFHISMANCSLLNSLKLDSYFYNSVVFGIYLILFVIGSR